MKLNLSAAAAAVATLATPALAADRPAPVPTPIAAEAAPQALVTPLPNKRYCYMADSTGTRIATKICKTRADWKEQGIIVPANL
jgi:hypothetical protein